MGIFRHISNIFTSPDMKKGKENKKTKIHPYGTLQKTTTLQNWLLPYDGSVHLHTLLMTAIWVQFYWENLHAMSIRRFYVDFQVCYVRVTVWRGMEGKREWLYYGLNVNSKSIQMVNWRFSCLSNQLLGKLIMPSKKQANSWSYSLILTHRD
jgi:hypothetical protein